jgi:histidine ammonia-lyase
MSYVEGFAYKTVTLAPESDIPERFERAAQVFESKYWREQLRDWDATFKPAAIKAHRIVELATQVVAIELLAASQGIDLLKPLTTSAPLAASSRAASACSAVRSASGML